VAQREAEIQRLERLVYDAVYALQKADWIVRLLASAENSDGSNSAGSAASDANDGQPRFASPAIW
jgi:hypothetical protein